MRLFFVRHGESIANAGQIYQGWLDSPLSPLGEQQALTTARAIAARPNLRPVAVYASPLSRAWRTGEAIADALGLTPIPHPGLREINVGAATGLAFTAVKTRWPDLAAQRQTQGLDHGWPEGETGHQFLARVGGTLDEIIATHRHDDGSPEATVVLASHGGTIRYALAHLRGETTRWPDDQIDNCSITEALIAPDGHQLVEINCVTHLHATGGQI
ncbi:MAG: histidine phosphatase family protein [Thermomicrobiales bacterium]